MCALQLNDKLDGRKAAVASHWGPQGLLPITCRWTYLCLAEPRASGESRILPLLDLSCSQHVLFGLEIHKSFDCFSLPDTSFQSDSFRAIHPPGFVIYISTIVWSPDFEEGGNWFYPARPHLSSLEIKENIQSPSTKRKTLAQQHVWYLLIFHSSFPKRCPFVQHKYLWPSQAGGGGHEKVLVGCWFLQNQRKYSRVEMHFTQWKINVYLFFSHFEEHNTNIALNTVNHLINPGVINSHVFS